MSATLCNRSAAVTLGASGSFRLLTGVPTLLSDEFRAKRCVS